MLDNLKRNIDILENGLTLKTDYTVEIELLDSYESNLSVMRYLGGNLTEIRELSKRIARIREWIREEIINK